MFFPLPARMSTIRKPEWIKKILCGASSSNLFKSWYYLLVYTICLPPNKVILTFKRIAPFQFESPSLNNRCQRFAAYLQRVWVREPFKINMFTHFVRSLPQEATRQH